MIDPTDLRAAVGAGIISERQAAALQSLAQSRRGAREAMGPGDEPFELFRGFNEIFIVVGLGVLSFGWIGAVASLIVFKPTQVQDIFSWTSIAGAAVLWLLSEYFIRRRRMIAPAIALSILFAVNAGYGFSGAFAEFFMLMQGDNSSLPLPIWLSIAATFLFWLRFKVPFALAMIALGTFGNAILIAGLKNGTPQSPSDLFLLSSGGPFAWITLALGLAVFAVAMAFDMSDPHRVTRRSANGFWLHVVAAPALVNTAALSLLSTETAWAKPVLAAVLGLFALVAILIDRRSFLIAAIGYTVFLAGTVFGGDSATVTVLALGAVLLYLGAQWETIRARLLRLLPASFPIHRLPPSHSAKA